MKQNFNNIWFPEDHCFSPAFIIRFFDTLLKKYGKVVLTHSQFQKSREMWVTAVFALALTKAKGINYWISAVNTDNTPDTYVFSWSDHPKIKDSRIADRVSIEVTEWEEHSTRDIVKDVISKKISKAYPGHYSLLVYVKRPNERTDLEAVFQQLKGLKINVAEILLLGSQAGKSEDNHLAVCLYPERFSVELSIREEFSKNKSEKEILIRRFGKNGESEVSDPHIVRLPDIDEIIKG